MHGEAKQLELGHRDWRVGRLASARARLEPLWRAAPADPTRAFPYARTLHECGESERALEVLDRVLDSPSPDDARGRASPPLGGSFVHRALVLYDLAIAPGEDGRFGARLAEDLERVGEANHLGRALRSLHASAAGDAPLGGLRLEPVALWNAEIAGRLLALLERAWLAAHSPGSDTFHLELFVPPSPDDAGAQATPSSEPPAVKRSFASAREWIAAIEMELARGDDRSALALLSREDLAPAWRTPVARALEGLAAWRSLEPDKARPRIATLLEGEPSVDLWFLAGLVEVRALRIAAAGQAFARAFRAQDFLLHPVLGDLARGLQLPLAEDFRR